jgi:hypothetical protein
MLAASPSGAPGVDVYSCGLLYCLSFLWSIVLSVILVVYCTVCHSCGLLYCLSFLWSIVLSVILVVYCIVCHSCGLLYCLSFLWSIVLSVILVVYCIVCHSCGLLYCLSFLWSIVLSVIPVVYCIVCLSEIYFDRILSYILHIGEECMLYSLQLVRTNKTHIWHGRFILEFTSVSIILIQYW